MLTMPWPCLRVSDLQLAVGFGRRGGCQGAAISSAGFCAVVFMRAATEQEHQPGENNKEAGTKMHTHGMCSQICVKTE